MADYKIFNDPIHGPIELHPLCIAIIDTPEFQRLRYLKQDGITNFVYPGATHTRFEHCIGVSHLAGQFVSKIKEKQPELGINDKDVLCVKVAGLCHDLGHGPFSHTWERFLKTVNDGKSTWTHEQCSVDLFDYLIKHNMLDTKFKHYFKEESSQYIKYIKQQISGDIESRKSNEWITGTPNMKKDFLYDIVANKISGVDVDKWDYLSRDGYYLGLKQSFDPVHLINFIRVGTADDKCQHICIRDKMMLNVYQMFHSRWTYHREAYQHKAVKIIEAMLVQALCAANEHFRVSDSNGKKYRLSEVGEHLEAFVKTSDDVLRTILISEDENLKEAKRILQRIEKRDLYGFVGQVPIKSTSKNQFHENKAKYVKGIYDCVEEPNNKNLQVEDIILDILRFDYGMNEENPVDCAYYYSKEEPTVAKRGEDVKNYSKMVPQNFEELFLICICKSKNDVADVRKGFEKWCLEMGFSVPNTDW